jgi:hypothetical protein
VAGWLVEALSLLSKYTATPGLPESAVKMNPLFGLPFSQAVTCAVTSKVTYPVVEIAAAEIGEPIPGPPTPVTVASVQGALAAPKSMVPAVATVPT